MVGQGPVWSLDGEDGALLTGLKRFNKNRTLKKIFFKNVKCNPKLFSQSKLNKVASSFIKSGSIYVTLTTN